MHVCVYVCTLPIHAQIVNQGQNFFYIKNYFMKKPNERTIARGAVPTYINIHMFTYKKTNIHTYIYMYVYMLDDKHTHKHTHTHAESFKECPQ